jgi:hypothetical protein
MDIKLHNNQVSPSFVPPLRQKNDLKQMNQENFPVEP